MLFPATLVLFACNFPQPLYWYYDVSLFDLYFTSYFGFVSHYLTSIVICLSFLTSIMHAMASSSYEKWKTKLKFSYWKIHQTWCRWLLKDFWLSCRRRSSEFLIIMCAPAQQWLRVYKILVRCGQWKSGNNKIASWNSSLAKLNGKSYELAVHVIQAALHDEYFVTNKLPGKYFSRQLYSYDQLIQQQKYCVRKFLTEYCGPMGLYLKTKKNWRIVW